MCLRSDRPANHDDDTFPADAETVTFVGRPFPLDEAHEHFSRLRRWGFTFSELHVYDIILGSYNLSSSLPCYVGSRRARRSVSNEPAHQN